MIVGEAVRGGRKYLNTKPDPFRPSLQERLYEGDIGNTLSKDIGYTFIVYGVVQDGGQGLVEG